MIALSEVTLWTTNYEPILAPRPSFIGSFMTLCYSKLVSFYSNCNHPCWTRIILKTFVHPWLTFQMTGFLGEKPIFLDLNVKSSFLVRNIKATWIFSFKTHVILTYMSFTDISFEFLFVLIHDENINLIVLPKYGWP